MTRDRIVIIAEAGVNHDGSLERAKELVDAASLAGADFVKFQTFRADRLVTRSAAKASYQEKLTDRGEGQLSMLRRLELDAASFHEIARHCEKRGIRFLSTPFDEESLELLVTRFRVPVVKIASGEITNGPLLLKVARTGRPVFLSTGMCDTAEIEQALGCLAFGYVENEERPGKSAFRRALYSPGGRRLLEERVTLLHCTTEYPAPIVEVNLSAMRAMADTFGLKVGYSDHTPGTAIAVAAAALGAVVIEKHFTLSRSLSGPDHAASLEPHELEVMIRDIRDVEAALGDGLKRPAASEKKNIPVTRKGLVAARPIRRGEYFSGENVTAKRPASGLSPMAFWEIEGLPAPRDFAEDESIEL